jgi:transketolase
MGFFDAIRRLRHAHGGTQEQRHRLAKAWGLDEEEAFDAETESAPARSVTPVSTEYDQAQWQKKMKRILAELPESRGEWDLLMAEARALKFDGRWLRQAQVEEFTLLARRAVAHGVFSEKDHQALDLARDLIGLPDAEAAALLHSIVAEAEEFFGKPIEGA